jgi:hypothetical protein
MKSMFGDTFSMNPVPQIFKPMLDLYANEDSFTGRQIETRGMENLSKSERMTPVNTSSWRELLGKAGDIHEPLAGADRPPDPSYFGWLGTHAAMTADLMAQPFSDVEKPARKAPICSSSGDFVKDLPADQSATSRTSTSRRSACHEVMADIKSGVSVMRPTATRPKTSASAPSIGAL